MIERVGSIFVTFSFRLENWFELTIFILFIDDNEASSIKLLSLSRCNKGCDVLTIISFLLLNCDINLTTIFPSWIWKISHHILISWRHELSKCEFKATNEILFLKVIHCDGIVTIVDLSYHLLLTLEIIIHVDCSDEHWVKIIHDQFCLTNFLFLSSIHLPKHYERISFRILV